MAKAPTMFRLDDDVREAIESLKKRDGVPFTAQVNLALRDWLRKTGVLKKPAKK